MKISLKWLSEYVEVPSDVQAFCDRLDLTGTGVEGVERLGDAFDHIVTGRVISKDAHPDSDHMWVCRVDVGKANLGADGAPEPLQIVCGAQNFNAGDHIVVALVGAELPGGIKIKKSKLRGVASCGMNCSARELGFGSDHTGIMILPEDAPVGVSFAEYQGLADTVLDLEITPNRPDSLSVVGFAREVGAMYDVDFRMPTRIRRAYRRPGERRGDRRGPKPALHGAPHPRREGGAVARLAGRTPCRHRPAFHQQRGGRDQLRSVRAGAAAAYVRFRHARP